MNKKHIETALGVLSKGKARHLWIHGILFHGVGISVLISLVIVIAEVIKKDFNIVRILIRVSIILIVFCTSGYFYGYWSWNLFEKLKKEIDKE